MLAGGSNAGGSLAARLPPFSPPHQQAFETALELSPKDPDLASKVARALVVTHEYR